MEGNYSQSVSKKFWIFILLTYIISWLFWIPLALIGQDVNGTMLLIPFALGGFGPSVAGIIMVYRNRDRQGRRDFWKRVIDFKRISTGWYLFIFLVFPALFAILFSLNSLFGNPLPQFERLSQIAANPFLLIGIVITGIITGPLSEELGWRGYALDRLQSRWSPFVASLVLAPFWWAWHLPLFFVRGTTQYQWGIGTPDFWYFMFGIVPLTFMLTWVYNHNQKSILGAILLHFMYNFTLGMVFPLSGINNLFHVLFLYVIAIGLIAAYDRLGNRVQTGLEAQ
ncbi:MAG: type II CAAX endopeptidase family protein [Anaerolineales bacterium]